MQKSTKSYQKVQFSIKFVNFTLTRIDRKIVYYVQDKDPVAPLYDAYHDGVVYF